VRSFGAESATRMAVVMSSFALLKCAARHFSIAGTSKKSALGSKLIKRKIASRFSGSSAQIRQILHASTAIFASWSCIRLRNTGHVLA